MGTGDPHLRPFFPLTIFSLFLLILAVGHCHIGRRRRVIVIRIVLRDSLAIIRVPTRCWVALMLIYKHSPGDVTHLWPGTGVERLGRLRLIVSRAQSACPTHLIFPLERVFLSHEWTGWHGDCPSYVLIHGQVCRAELGSPAWTQAGRVAGSECHRV